MDSGSVWRVYGTAAIVIGVWSALALVIAAVGILFVASRPERIEWLALIADCVPVLAMAPIGWHMFGRTGARDTVEVPRGRR